ncbi:SDR family oxidoreductase [Pseudobacteriovorax antillogorgiicola]|uniref:3-oxoacyl-[acyl-carrier protein] reductase n=1 Tax=Pseudobacteriovorax antillogorgiicola TaxID=1513793 RepID=A0A1Y6CMB8_9BACT|nr:SDR family oxidoreductase [Pseudobacteriovorax antillogorgiicola]TCS47642.1 3-oxoacyl-[acyl-carrier protein] reductase [Pseudobacteriovorax antillogorgiicola]SMF59888.1 3-oxoacyl-[acyl-carrier protein] reductase [Pseudobacteriovorax antillogorgiicola]
MDLRLSGKKALVCGASQGIGRAVAQELALLGCQVIALARNESKLRDTVASLEGDGHQILVADHGRTQELKDAVHGFVENHGAIHILINNSGGPPGGPIQDAGDDAFLAAYTRHLLANVNLSRVLLPGMKDAGFGRIINIISTSVKIPIKGLGVSNATRGAVANWAKTLSYEVASHGITVNNVLPGATETSRLDQIIAGQAEKQGKSQDAVVAAMKGTIPAARFGKDYEVAAVAAFLASPAAAYVNGASIPVDGGRTGSL